MKWKTSIKKKKTMFIDKYRNCLSLQSPSYVNVPFKNIWITCKPWAKSSFLPHPEKGTVSEMTIWLNIYILIHIIHGEEENCSTLVRMWYICGYMRPLLCLCSATRSTSALTGGRGGVVMSIWLRVAMDSSDGIDGPLPLPWGPSPLAPPPRPLGSSHLEDLSVKWLKSKKGHGGRHPQSLYT